MISESENTPAYSSVEGIRSSARIKELEQIITQMEADVVQLIIQHNSELKSLQTQIAELNSANVKYRQMLEEKSNG